MAGLKLSNYEINFLTEGFPLSLGAVRRLFENDFRMERSGATEESIKMLRRFYALGYIKFQVWLFYRKGSRIDVVLNEPEHGYQIVADQEFWLSLESEQEEVWSTLTSEMVETSGRSWDIGVDLTEKFLKDYFEPDDTEYWKLNNEE